MSVYKAMWLITCFFVGFLLSQYYMSKPKTIDIRCQDGYQVVYDKEKVPTILYDKLGEPIKCIR